MHSFMNNSGSASSNEFAGPMMPGRRLVRDEPARLHRRKQVIHHLLFRRARPWRVVSVARGRPYRRRCSRSAKEIAIDT